jgi:hypothetical protein
LILGCREVNDVALRRKRKSFHVIRPEFERNSLRYMISYSSAPTQAYLSIAGLTNVLNNTHKGFRRKDFPLLAQPTNITFRNLPLPFIKRSLMADPNTNMKCQLKAEHFRTVLQLHLTLCQIVCEIAKISTFFRTSVKGRAGV